MAHSYISTACCHGRHRECRKSCKFCESTCLCPCHRNSDTNLLDNIHEKLDTITSILKIQQNQEKKEMATVQQIKDQADKVMAAIETESVKDDAIILLVQGNASQLTTLREELAAAIANGADPAALDEVLQNLQTAEASSLTNAQKVVDAINAQNPPQENA